MRKINKVMLCSNMLGNLPEIITLLERRGIEIAGIFLMKEDYYLKNKSFFDKMISVGLLCDLGAYLESKAYNVSRIDNINDNKIAEEIDSINPDLIINNGMMSIYKKRIIKKYKVLNTHAGYLPFYRGRCGASWAIYNGATKHGITCHLVDEGIDTGPIVAQREIEIKKDDYVYDLLLKEKKLFPILIEESIEKLNDRGFTPKKQMKDGGTYFPVLDSEIDGVIFWQFESTERIYNKIRAFSFPYAGAFTVKDGSRYVISKARLPKDNRFICAEPGIIFGEAENGSLKVTTTDGYIIIDRIITAEGEKIPISCWKVGEYVYTNLVKEYLRKSWKK